MSTISSEILDGKKRQRNRFNELQETIPISFAFSNDDMAVFRSWYHWKLFNGAASFNLDLLLGEGLETYIVKMKDGKFSAKHVSHDRWEVSTSVFIEDTPVMSEDDVDDIITANPSDPEP